MSPDYCQNKLDCEKVTCINHIVTSSDKQAQFFKTSSSQPEGRVVPKGSLEKCQGSLHDSWDGKEEKIHLLHEPKHVYLSTFDNYLSLHFLYSNTGIFTIIGTFPSMVSFHISEKGETLF